MATQYANELRRLYSQDRLARYVAATHDDIDLVSIYMWNIELCEALYPSLCALEVTLRNSVHQTLSLHVSNPEWYDVIALGRDEHNAVQTGKRKIAASGKDVTPGRVIASMGFGFWTGILTALYGNSPKGPRLWTSPDSQLLIQAFPNAPPSIQPYRSRIHSRFDGLRRLRNRVFHYECVFDDPHLVLKHANTLEAIGWISPEIQRMTEIHDRFLQVHRSGFPGVREKLTASEQS